MQNTVGYRIYTGGDRYLKIPSHIFIELSKKEQQKDKRESGGILFGHIYDNYDEILELSQPSRHDKSGLFSFIRKKEPAQIKINRAWDHSGGHLVYLGEWHTHPGHIPNPSSQDRDMIKNMLYTTSMEISYLYLIIAGYNSTYWIARQEKNELVVMTEEN